AVRHVDRLARSRAAAARRWTWLHPHPLRRLDREYFVDDDRSVCVDASIGPCFTSRRVAVVFHIHARPRPPLMTLLTTIHAGESDKMPEPGSPTDSYDSREIASGTAPRVLAVAAETNI